MNHVVAARNARASAALDELALVIPRCKTDEFSWAFLPAAFCLWTLLPSGVFSGDILTSFKSTMNLCLLRGWLDFLNLHFSHFLLLYSLLGIMILRPFWFRGVFLVLVICSI